MNILIGITTNAMNSSAISVSQNAHVWLAALPGGA